MLWEGPPGCVQGHEVFILMSCVSVLLCFLQGWVDGAFADTLTILGSEMGPGATKPPEPAS